MLLKGPVAATINWQEAAACERLEAGDSCLQRNTCDSSIIESYLNVICFHPQMYSTIHLSDEDQTDDIDVDIWKFVFQNIILSNVCVFYSFTDELDNSFEKSCSHISLSTDILL